MEKPKEKENTSNHWVSRFIEQLNPNNEALNSPEKKRKVGFHVKDCVVSVTSGNDSASLTLEPMGVIVAYASYLLLAWGFDV